MKRVLVSVVLLACLLRVAASAYGYGNNWNRAYYNYMKYYQTRYGRQNPYGQLAGYQVLNSAKWMPMGVYNNYFCKILGSSVGKRSIRHKRIVPNRGLYLPDYMMSTSILRRYANRYFGKDKVDDLDRTLRQFFNVSIDAYIHGMIRRKQQGYPYKSIRDEMLRGLLSRYSGMDNPRSVNNALRAINIFNKAGQAQVRRHADAYGSSNCMNLSPHGQQYLCSYLHFAMSITQVCGVNNLVSMLYNDCSCRGGHGPDVVYVPIDNPHPNPAPATAAATTATTTSTTTTTTSPGSTVSTDPSATTTTTSTTTTTATPSDCGISTINPARDFPLIRYILRQWRIVGGINAQSGEFPWMAVVSANGGLCGGSILNSTHIITAAHCVDDFAASTITVDVGEQDRFNDNDHTTFQVSTVTVHENYQPGSEANDIALLELSTPIDFNTITDAAPICLPSGTFTATVGDGTECIVAGWGTLSFQGQIPNILQEVSVPTYAGTSCTANFNTNPTTPATQLCAGAPGTGGVDSCQGDSGSPLFCSVNGRWVQYGLVSYGDGCANPGEAGVYTDVSQYVDWINGV
ncbi:serine proteinase stubble-like [Haliotis rufescens]|uniref:serine proteinase stubble-like n=1 Tax=Haliotis rufescens TaxID=6454 RepID=UPI00201E7E44|nr:serine proteinase stubble-like [Haliotis rufescens]